MTFLRLIEIEVFKLRRRSMTWILLGVLVVLIVVIYVLFWLVTEKLATQAGGPAVGNIEVTNLAAERSRLYLEQAVPFGLQITQIVGTFLVIILAGSAIGSEYDWHTIRPFVTATPSRWHYLGAKVVAISVLTVIGTFIGMVTAVASSAVISEIAGESDYGFIDAGFLGGSALSYLRTLLAMAPYLGLSVFFGTVGRSTLSGIGFCLGIRFLEVIITSLLQLTGRLGGQISNAFPGTNVETLMFGNGLQSSLQVVQQSTFAVPRVSAEWSALILAVYALGFILATLMFFDRRDIVG